MIVNRLMTGSLAPLGPRGILSGIKKSAVVGQVPLRAHGLEGDSQADLKHHGGPEKAVHHYPFDHYPLWREDLGDLNLLTFAGAFGENVSTLGLTEKDVAVGDTYRLGSALIQVSQGRQPCWKLNARFEILDMARRVQSTGRTGWYYRVLEEGDVSAGDQMTLVDRPSPEWTIERIWRVLYVDTLDMEQLKQIADLEPLAEGWRSHAAKRVASGLVEDWSDRLEGAPSAAANTPDRPL